MKAALTGYRAIICYASLYIVLVLNAPFLLKAVGVVTELDHYSVAFLFSIPLLLFFLTIIFILFTSLLITVRMAIFLNIAIASLILYAAYNYGVVFDKEMLRNFIQTNAQESTSYINLISISFFIVAGLIPATLFCYFLPAVALKDKVKSFFTLLLVSTLFILVIVFVFYKDYASVGRNNRFLTNYVNPYQFYASLFRVVKEDYFEQDLPYKVLDKSSVIVQGEQGNLTVIVVGETARAQNFSLGGYAQPTNSNTQAQQVKYFSQVSSCGTATAVSLPCMFSRLDKSDYNQRIANNQDNVLDLISRAGYHVFWIDNDGGCKEVCNKVNAIKIDPALDSRLCLKGVCYDQVLVDYLAQVVDLSENARQVIVLHMIGSHGPTYYLRYPPEKAKFVPDCPRSDIQNCSQESLINTYDNTIAYTDFVLSQIIDQLKASKAASVNLLYISDHGESLGEKGLYLHGVPYAFAPKEQTHVPMIYWSNKLQSASYGACVDGLLSNKYSHDNLFDTLLGLVGVKSKVYNSERDVLKTCE